MARSSCGSGRSWATVTWGWYGNARSGSTGPEMTSPCSRAQPAPPSASTTNTTGDTGRNVSRALEPDRERLVVRGDRRQVVVELGELVGVEQGRRQQRDVRRDLRRRWVTEVLAPGRELAAVGLGQLDGHPDPVAGSFRGAHTPCPGGTTKPTRSYTAASVGAATARARSEPAASTASTRPLASHSSVRSRTPALKSATISATSFFRSP